MNSRTKVSEKIREIMKVIMSESGSDGATALRHLDRAMMASLDLEKKTKKEKL